MPADHNAVDSTLGYNFQTLHGLVVLLQASDDESVTLELSDDITLHHSPARFTNHNETRFQVSHSTRSNLPEVTIKSPKLWKTFRIWAAEYDPSERYFLLTCAPVSLELICLTAPADRSSLQAALETEAAFVINDNEQGTHEHRDRVQGCRAFLTLNPSLRADLLARVTLCVDGPNILDVDRVLDGQLRNIARPEKRSIIIRRLREYWMNRACLSLTGEAPRHIKKSELQECLENLANEVLGTGLPDDYGVQQPPSNILTPDIMRRQIEIVNGGIKRINRAKTAHWKSRNQRQKWLEDDVSMASRLNQLDQKLIDAWKDRHGPMCDDCAATKNAEKQQHGCKLLDWSHNDAPQWPITIGRGPVPPFVTQGSYQDLANQLSVGWHPDFETLLEPPGEL